MKEYRININGTMYNVSIEEVGNSNQTIHQVTEPVKPAASAPQKPAAAPSTPKPTADPATNQYSSSEGKAIKSPLPGIILDILVNVGDTVKAGQKVILLEAMKMENNIEADIDGIVKGRHRLRR